MSVAEYERWLGPRPDGEHWELLDGEPVVRAPPSARHQRIVRNVAQSLDRMARERGCGAYPESLLIVYQNEPRIEVWRRDAGWTMQVAGSDAAVALPELGSALPVQDADARVNF